MSFVDEQYRVLGCGLFNLFSQPSLLIRNCWKHRRRQGIDYWMEEYCSTVFCRLTNLAPRYLPVWLEPAEHTLHNRDKKGQERGRGEPLRSEGGSTAKKLDIFQWCCYITVDSAMAPSQNGFCSYKISIHKKTNIIQIMTKNIIILIYLIFYHREILKLDHFMTLSHRSVTQPLQNQPFCSSNLPITSL